MQDIEWKSTTHDYSELAPGIYAVAYCWDYDEGIFCGADVWDGKHWEDLKPVTMVSSAPFDTIEAARSWAKANDRF